MIAEQKQTAFKQTEVGEIPEDWEVTSISLLAERIMVGIASAATHAYRKKGIVLLRNQNIRNGYLDDDDLLYISEDYERGFVNKRLKKGDLITARTGYPGATCIIPERYDGAQSFTTLVIRPKPKDVNANYLNHYINSALGQAFFLVNQIGGSQKNVNAGTLKNMPIPLPSTLAEQTAIATALSDADALLSRLEILIAKKKAIKQGAMQELLRPKEGWEVKTLGEIGTFKNGINKSSSDFGYGYPFINLLDVYGRTRIESSRTLGLINSTEAERKLYDLRKGDVVFIRSSVKPEGVGLTCVINKNLVDTVFSGFIIRFRDKGLLSTEFKEYCFSTEDFRGRLLSNSTVSANTNINQEALKNLVLYFPADKTEQTRIARILSDMDAEIEKLEQRLAKQKQLKQGLMQVLLTGKIRLV